MLTTWLIAEMLAEDHHTPGNLFDRTSQSLRQYAVSLQAVGYTAFTGVFLSGALQDTASAFRFALQSGRSVWSGERPLRVDRGHFGTRVGEKSLLLAWGNNGTDASFRTRFNRRHCLPCPVSTTHFNHVRAGCSPGPGPMRRGISTGFTNSPNQTPQSGHCGGKTSRWRTGSLRRMPAQSAP